MRKGIMVLIAIAVLAAFAVPAMAESVFNDMAKSISAWKCPSKCEPVKATTATVKTACTTTTDALNNIVPTGTVK